MRHSAAVCALVILLVGCQQTGHEAASRIRPEDSVFGGIYDYPVRLTDGKFVGAPFVPGGASRPQVSLLQQPRWQMDLNGDGNSESIVLLQESSGGSGSFIYLAVAGLASATDSTGPATVPAFLLGDRVHVKLAVLAADGRLKLVVEPGAVPIGLTSTHIREFEVIDGNLVPLTRVSGLLTYAHEIRQLIRCSDDEAFWISQAQSGVVSDFFEPPGPDPYRAKFASVLGRISAAPDAEFAADFEQQVVVTQLQRLENEGPGCARNFGEATFLAYGEEPFWSLAVYADRLEYHTIGAERVTFRFDSGAENLSWSAENGVISAAVTATDGDGRRLHFELRAQSCQDTMAGNRYAWQALLTLDSRSRNGCAISAASVLQ